MDIRQILAAVAAQAAQGVRTNTPADSYVQAIGKLMEHASRWSAISAAGLRCTIIMVTPLAQHFACTAGAIGVCVACNHPVCFSHAMISPSSGDLVCYGCVAKLTGQSPYPVEMPSHQAASANVPPPKKQGPRPGPQQQGPFCTCREPWQLDADCPMHGKISSDDAARNRKRYLRALELEESADWDDVVFSYRQLVKKHHPDKHPPSRKERQEQRIKKINVAYTWLKKYYEEAA